MVLRLTGPEQDRLEGRIGVNSLKACRDLTHKILALLLKAVDLGRECVLDVLVGPRVIQ